MLIPNNLNTILKEKQIPFEQLAADVDVPYELLKEIHLGQKEFTPEILKTVADYLGIKELDLLPNRKKSVYQNIGIQLRQIREEKKLTLIELGKKSGVSYTHISEIERGKTCASLKTLEKLAKVLEIPTSFFFQLEENLTLGEKIRRLREKQNLTQIQLAEKIGVSLSLIGQIETGRVKPALNTLHNIAGVFGVGITYFLLSESEEALIKQKTIGNAKGTWGKLSEVTEGLSENDLDLIVDIINILRKYGRLGLQMEEIDVQTKEILQIIKELSEEDKNFVIENAKWLLKKSKSY